MLDKRTKRRNAFLMLITGFIMLVLGIAMLVIDVKNMAPNWYYWIGLILIADIFIIAGVRQLKKYPSEE